jgi:hypothetical protein
MEALDWVLFGCLLLAAALSFVATACRLFTSKRYLSYDAWVFGMSLAMALQLYDYRKPP